MKILHIISGLDTGGAEIMLSKLISSLDRDKIQNAVISLKDRGTVGDEIEKEGAQVHCLHLHDYASIPKLFTNLRRIIHKEKPDIIQGWMYHGNAVALVGAKITRTEIKTVWNIRHSLHDYANEKSSTKLAIHAGAKFSRKISAIIYNSHVSAKQHESLGYHVTKTVVIGNGFDCEKFKPDLEARRKLREQLGVSEREILIGHVARYHPVKDHSTFLRAVAMLVKDEKDVRIVMAGRGIDVCNRSLSQSCEALSLEKKVFLIGEYDDMPGFMAGLDLFCLSSVGEAFPNVLGEAMACEVPCVATDVGDSASIIGNTGEITAPSDPKELAGALKKIIQMDCLKRKAMGRRARQRVEENFSMKAVAKKYEDIYYRVWKHRV